MSSDASSNDRGPDMLERKDELKQDILDTLGNEPGNRKTMEAVQEEIDEDYEDGLYDDAFGDLVVDHQVAGADGFYWEARDDEAPIFLYDADEYHAG
jgi:hypothetical protein